MNNATLINQTSSDVEYFSPPFVVQAAREVMNNSIDLDPASSEAANLRVGARAIFTIDDDGLEKPWRGNVWLNWPFGRAEEACAADCDKDHVHHSFPLHGNAAWSAKLIAEWRAGNVEQACVITYACTSEAWFKPLLRQPQVFLVPRTNYYTPDGAVKKGVTKGSAVTYFGPNVNRFAQKFTPFGVVKIPYE